MILIEEIFNRWLKQPYFGTRGMTSRLQRAGFRVNRKRINLIKFIRVCWKGRALDNIMIERFWRSLKYEEVYLNSYDTLKEAVFSINLTKQDFKKSSKY